MPGVQNWDPYRTAVQGGLPDGNFVNAQFVLLCAGPPRLADIAGSGGLAGSTNDLVYPIGLTQNISISQNKASSRIFEIGSDASYFITGRTVGQLGLSRVVYHGPNILRALYAYYSASGNDGTVKIDPLYVGGTPTGSSYPFTDGNGIPVGESQAQVEPNYKRIRIPPGYGDLYINLASDLFSQPLGLLLIIMDNNENVYGQVYLENCLIPSHSIGMDANGLIMQESVGIQYERIAPIPGTAVKVLDKILDDTARNQTYS